MVEPFGQVATANEPWVRALAREQAGGMVAEDLLYAVGMEALWRCAQRFDAQRGVQFRTFAQWRVRGAMRDVREREMRFWRTSAGAAYGSVDALDAAEVDGAPALEWLADGAEGPAEIAERALTSQRLAAEIARLPERWQQILGLYYCEGLSQSEIGRVVDVSQQRVGQILCRAADLLRARLGADNAVVS